MIFCPLGQLDFTLCGNSNFDKTLKEENKIFIFLKLVTSVFIWQNNDFGCTLFFTPSINRDIDS